MSSLIQEKPADAILVIDVRAKKYADARAELAELVTQYQLLVQRVTARRVPAIKRAVAKCADLQASLEQELKGHSELFVKPRTMTLHGIKVGYQKGKGKLVWDDDAKLIERIVKMYGDDEAYEHLIRTTEEPITAALETKPADDLKKLGIRIEGAGDAVYIKAADSAVDKLVAAILKEGSKSEEDAA